MIDELTALRGLPYKVNDYISVRQPTLDEIYRYGEQEYYGLIYALCATPADRKVQIWESMHIFWDEVDEYDLFLSIALSLKEDDVSIIFGDLDWASFVPVCNASSSEIVLANKDGAVIDRSIHAEITNALRMMNNLKKNVDVGYDRYTKEIMIEDDQDAIRRMKNKPYQSQLAPLISAMTNCGEFKYGWDTVWMLPIGVFMDAVRRVQKRTSYDSLIAGVYANGVDMDKLNKKDLDWMGNLD